VQHGSVLSSKCHV